MPDYTTYTIEQLNEACGSVCRETYPTRYQAIKDEIAAREQVSRELYIKAVVTHTLGGPPEASLELFREIAEKHPQTQSGRKAADFIGGKTVDGIKEGERICRADILPLTFQGTAREYFRIWIVNLCLTILTLGVFSAWAKVRKKRYLYSHLTLDGTPFQYLAKPVPILKGRIIAALLVLIYYLSRDVYPDLLPWVLGGGMLLAPWMFVQSVAFNARYTAFRGIVFNFHATALQAALRLFALGLVPVFFIGTFYQWWGYPAIGAGVVFVSTVLFPFWLCQVKNFMASNTSYGGVYFQFGAKGGQFFGTYFLAFLIVAGFSLLIGAVTVTFTTFLTGGADLGENKMPYIILTLSFISYVGYLISYALIQADLTNKVWNNLQLGPLRFSCNLRTLELAKIYITNVIGIVCSLGLLIPWAVIRTFRYRVEHTQVRCKDELTGFQGMPADGIRAIGAEVTDFFNLDLSL